MKIRKLINVDKTWEAFTAIKPEDYNKYFFIILDTESDLWSSNRTKVIRLDTILLKDINYYINNKDSVFVYAEGGDK